MTLSSAIVDTQLADDLVTDVLRSAWIIESGRAVVFATWAGDEPRYAASAQRARRRADLIKESLAPRVRGNDAALVEPHARWIATLAGAGPSDEPFGHMVLVRMGDWVDAHAGSFLEAGVDSLRALGDEEKAEVEFPTAFPAAPPFDPVTTVPVEPPGDVRFTFAILGDLHFGSPTAEAMARAAIADVNASGAALAIQLGDVTDHGDLAEFELAARVLGDLEMPLTTMLGNHDVLSYSEARLTGREYYASAFGREPDGVLLEHRGIRFAVLDSADHAASPFPNFDLVSGSFTEDRGGAVVRGSLTSAQHEILAEVAAPRAPAAFVFLHHPVQPFTGFPPVLFGLRDADSGRLHAVCDSGNVWGVFAGHTHRNARTLDLGIVPCHEVAVPRDYPFGYALVDVTESGYAYRFEQISDEGLLRDGYARSGRLQRSYALGSAAERSFVWTAA
jgi:Calcineurin-like phosphoesterase